MKHIAVLLFIIIYASAANSEVSNPETLWEKANEAYINEEYAYAAELFENIINQGYESYYLHYNLGNAYFKDNKIGLAILNFERAKRLNPSSDRVNHNLMVANSRIIDRLEPVPKLFYQKWWNSLINVMNTNQWAISTIVLLFIFLVFASLFLFLKNMKSKKISFYTSIFILLLTVFSFIITNQSYLRTTSENEAIVLSVRVTAKSAPSKTSTDLFVIHEGTKVEIINTLGHWTEIKLANGNIGWIEENSIKII